MERPTQRLILLFDGTWNDPLNQTNVYRMARLVGESRDGVPQRFFYSPGVGTHRWQRVLGGCTGYGLTANLLAGYDWLIRRYRTGTEVYVFGFSRGAFTARSFAGLIRKCGLLDLSTPRLLDAARRMYRDRSLAPTCDRCVEFRARHSIEIGIHFLGVWDTVGSLGVPGTRLSERALYAWHDTRLSKIVRHAYHAMAIDEHRRVYDCTMWTSPDGTTKDEQEAVEQRWFIGAHSNVGGGYGDDPLADLPLRWLRDKAHDAGLGLKAFEPRQNAHCGDPRDSFVEFMWGAYGRYRCMPFIGRGRFHRPFEGSVPGERAVGVTVDESVWDRWRDDASYRPPTLVDAGLAPTT